MGRSYEHVTAESGSSTMGVRGHAPWKNNKCPLPLTDPREAVAQRMLNIPYRFIW